MATHRASFADWAIGDPPVRGCAIGVGAQTGVSNGNAINAGGSCLLRAGIESSSMPLSCCRTATPRRPQPVRREYRRLLRRALRRHV